MSFLHEEVQFESNGNTLMGNLLYPTKKKFNPPYPAVVHYHGFPGDANKLAGVGISLVKAGYAFLSFDFQGHRSSEGKFSLAGEVQNAIDALDFVKNQTFVEIDESRIGVYGVSLGGAVAICTSAKRKDISLTVVRVPVYDTHDFFNFPWIPETFRTMSLYMPEEVRDLDKPGKLDDLKAEATQTKNNPMDVVGDISPRKLFILASGQDELIPIQGVRRLFDRTRKPRILKIQPFADHNLSSPEFFHEAVGIVCKWFKEHL